MAGPLPPGPAGATVTSVERTMAVPPMVIVAVALAVKTPGTALLIVSVQLATLPTTSGEAQVCVCTPGAGATDTVIGPNATGVAPDGIPVTVTVKSCGSLSGFTA